MFDLNGLPWLAAVFILVLVIAGIFWFRPWLRSKRQRDEAAIVASTPPEQRADVAKGLAELERAASEGDAAPTVQVNVNRPPDVDPGSPPHDRPG